MDFADRIRSLASRIPQQLNHITTEEATKNALVMPFINALGYNVFDPTEVVPEFTADVGIKKGEKVDYAIMREGRPTILFECKTFGTNLATVHASQLYRYFSVTDAPVAVLTNGTVYNFYMDLDSPNRLDAKPFLIFDMLNIDENLIPALKKLTRESFNAAELTNDAVELKYTGEIKRILEEEIRSPSADFVRYLGGKVFVGRMTQNVREVFIEIVRRALNQFIAAKVNERLQSALDGSVESITAKTSPTKEEFANEDQDSKDKRVETTNEELEGFFIVKALLRDKIDPARLIYRDAQSYFGILLDDNNRKPICRLHFNSEKIKYVTFFNEKREPERVDINSLNDLYKYSDKLTVALKSYE